MPTSLDFERHLEALVGATAALASRARSTDMDTAIVSCPRWSMADLVAHQGMVHRWAASNLRQDGADTLSKEQILAEVPSAELVAWLEAGFEGLLATLREVEADVDAMVFLKDAPAPREFWARRQAHETTIHSVDALAGTLGRLPRAAEAEIDTDLAVDGIDELLCGFITRGKKLATDEPHSIAVVPSDSDRVWTLHLGPEGVVTDPDGDHDADATFSGTAAELYLGLWNRGEELVATGRPGVLEHWRQVQRVRWS